MPNPKDNAKATGDVHLPEIESEDLEQQGAHPKGAGTPGTQERHRNADGSGSPPRGGNHGGEIKDREAPTSDSYGDTRDSGEEPT
jgi:hypothetical protein